MYLRDLCFSFSENMLLEFCQYNFKCIIQYLNFGHCCKESSSMETRQFQKSLDLSLPIFMIQKHFPLGWRHKRDQKQGATVRVGVGRRGEERCKQEGKKSFHRQGLFLLGFSLGSENQQQEIFILFYFIFTIC